MPDLNPDIEIASGNSRKFSRRDFLKLSGVVGTATILGFPRPEGTTKPANDILSIETPEARYFPIYESHPQPASGKELKSLPPQDVFLYEYVRDSRDFIDAFTSPQVILDAVPKTLKGLPDSKREYIVPRDHLEWLRENNTKICFEGYDLPNSASLTALLPMVGEAIIGAGGALSLVFSKAKEGSNKVVTRRQFLKLATGLATVWGLSPTAFLLITPADKTEVKLSALERTIIKAHGLSSQTHPGNPIIFFRNIMFARKLQFLGEVMSKEKGQRAQITYNVGKMHAGIEDFLHIGKDWTLAFLNMIPEKYLKEVIDANGGIENFCSNVVFDPNAQNATKTVLVDQALKSFLDKKLDLSS